MRELLNGNCSRCVLDFIMTEELFVAVVVLALFLTLEHAQKLVRRWIFSQPQTRASDKPNVRRHAFICWRNVQVTNVERYPCPPPPQD